MRVDVRDLWRSTEGLTPIEVRTTKLKFDAETWVSNSDRDVTDWLTPEWIVEHAERILRADLSYPIIIKSRGWEILDGNHRLAKAILEGRTTVRVVRAGPEYDDVVSVVSNLSIENTIPDTRSRP